MKFALPALVALLAVPSIAAAQDPPPEPDIPALVVVPRFTVLFADVGGRVECDEASFPAPILDGSSVHFDSDLDLDDSVPTWIAEIAAFKRAGGRYSEVFSVSWQESSYEGSATFNSTETFNGRTFTAGSLVESKVRYRSWGADFTVTEGETPFENTWAAFRLGARYADFHVQMESAGQETDERLRLLYLGGGFKGEGQWGGWLTGVLQASVYFSFGGYDDPWDLEYQEWGGVIFEGLAGVSATLSVLHLEGGWRYLSNSSYAKTDSSDKFEDNDFSLELSGPYLSATFRF